MDSRIQAEIRKLIRGKERDIRRLSGRIHSHPELAYEEERACAWQVAQLRRWGFRVKSPYAGVRTAYCAEQGRGAPVFGVLSEYDALPGIGHACGHNLIAASAVGAGYALAAIMRKRKAPGTVRVIGTPAEEAKGGKIEILENGGFDGLDAVIMAHGSFRTVPDTGSTAVTRVAVTFLGQAAHAAAMPEKGRNALDGVMLLFQGINAWRQHLLETCRVHGIVTEGGVAPNIVPERASCVFYLRSLADGDLSRMMRRFRNIAKGAALMTDTKVEFETWGVPYATRRPNRALNDAYVEAARGAGLNVTFPKQTGRGSSDFGNVSHAMPGAHVYFGVTDKEIPLHSPEFEKAAGTPRALRAALQSAEAMAVVGYRYMTDKDFRSAVRRDFAESRKNGGSGGKRTGLTEA